MKFVKIINIVAIIIILSILSFDVAAQVAACTTFPLGSSYRKICEEISSAMCKILLIIQGIVAGVATVLMVWAGIKWMGAEVENPQDRDEARKRIFAILIGIFIVLIATHLINYLFGAEVGTFSCP